MSTSRSDGRNIDPLDSSCQAAYNMSMKDIQVGARITEELAARIEAATDKMKDPYAPTLSRLIERGIELAIAELTKRRGK